MTTAGLGPTVIRPRQPQNQTAIQPGIVIGTDPATMTPNEWLQVLTRRVDFGWARTELLRSYVDSNAPMPEMGKNTKEAWQKFQREARTNWGLIIIESVVNRLIPNGITVDGDNKSPLAKQAQQIWRRNRLDAVFREWVRYGLTFRQSYMTVWQGDPIPDGDGKRQAIITADSPESMGVSADPLQPWRVRAAVRWWRDLDMQQDQAIVWGMESSQKFRRTLLSLNAPTQIPNNAMLYLPVRLLGAWDPIATPNITGQRPPVVVYNNPGFAGDFELHIDLINRINRVILERLTASAMQAFRQRAMKGGLPKYDAQGNEIDWGAIFEPAPGAVWDLPEGIDIWESQPLDIRPMLEAAKDDIRQLSAMNATPWPIMMPDNANQSATGADNAKDAHIFKCGERLVEAKAGIEAALALALRTEGADLGTEGTPSEKRVEVLFKPVDRVTISEMYAAAQAASSAGESWPSIARNILGYSPEQIAQDQIDKTQEALRASMFMGNPAVPPTPPGDVGVRYSPVNPNRAVQSALGKQEQNGQPPQSGTPQDVSQAALGAQSNTNPKQAVNQGQRRPRPARKPNNAGPVQTAGRVR
jgi:hypothetical protein